MKEREGKSRSRSQKIGEEGERLFALWATRRGMSANKAERDYGIDYFCEILERVGSKEMVTGKLIAVQVRAIAGVPKGLRLDRNDAANALLHEGPFLLAGVDTLADCVYYRFMDAEFMEELQKFLKRRPQRKTHSISLKTMQADEGSFRTQAERVLSPGFQHRLRVRALELEVRAGIPGSELTVSSSSRTSSAILDVPWVNRIFEIDPAGMAEARSKALIRGEPLLPGKDGVHLRPILSSIFHVTDIENLLVRGTAEELRPIHVNTGGATFSAIFRRREFGDESGFLSDTGLFIAVSQARLREGRWAHQMSDELVRDGATALGKARQEIPFLAALRPGASIRVWDHDQHGIDLWGMLPSIGPAVSAIQAVYGNLGLPLDNVYLADLADEEFGKSLSALEAILVHKVQLPAYMPGFWLGPATEPNADVTLNIGRYCVPLVMNIKEHGVAIWVEGKCRVVCCEDLICGFEPLSQDSCTPEILDRIDKSVQPEAWPGVGWPIIEILQAQPCAEDRLWTATVLPFGGDVWIEDGDSDQP